MECLADVCRSVIVGGVYCLILVGCPSSSVGLEGGWSWCAGGVTLEAAFISGMFAIVALCGGALTVVGARDVNEATTPRGQARQADRQLRQVVRTV